MKATKRQFEAECKKHEGFQTWFTEPHDSGSYVIEIWVKMGYQIGDNNQTLERVYVYQDEGETAGDGWRKGIAALRTIVKAEQ